MPGRSAVLLLSVAFFTVGCVSTGTPRLDYEPAGDAPAAAAPITIGVLPLSEGRPPKQIDFLFGALFKTYIPLLPYVKAPYERLDEYQAQKAQEDGRPQDATELFPIGFARAIALDLASSGVAREVRLLSCPEDAGGVDLVMGGTLRSTELRVNTTSYMLGAAGVLLWILPIPLGSVAADVELDLTLRDRSGAEVWTHHGVGRASPWRTMYSRTVTLGTNPMGSAFRLEMKRYGRNDEGIVPNSCWAYHAAALREAMVGAKRSLIAFLSSRAR